MRSLVGKALCIASVLCAAALAALPARGTDGSGDLWAVVTAPMAPTLYDGERDDEVLYGMIGLLGAKIWKENEVDFGNPVNLVPVAAGIIIGVGDVSLKFSKSFTLGGIALGTIVTVGVYHLARWLAPHELSDAAGGTNIILDAPGMYVDDDTPQ